DRRRIEGGVQSVPSAAAGRPLSVLEVGQSYYVHFVGANQIQLLDATGGNVVAVGTPADATTVHFLTPAAPVASGSNALGDFKSVAFTVANNILTLQDSGLIEGQAVIYTIAGTITILSGDGIEIQAGAKLEATSSIYLAGDFGSVDTAGATITIQGSLKAPEIAVNGGSQDDTILIYLAADDSTLLGHTTILGGAG